MYMWFCKPLGLFFESCVYIYMYYTSQSSTVHVQYMYITIGILRLMYIVSTYMCVSGRITVVIFSLPLNSSSRIAVRSQRVWGSKGYAREVPPIAIATPSTVIATPQQVEPVVGDSEGERERGGEEERSDMENTSS